MRMNQQVQRVTFGEAESEDRPEVGPSRKKTLETISLQ